MIIDAKTCERACFIRADDMVDFPGKALIEELMQVEYVPYTAGISSTLLREQQRKNVETTNKSK